MMFSGERVVIIESSRKSILCMLYWFQTWVNNLTIVYLSTMFSFHVQCYHEEDVIMIKEKLLNLCSKVFTAWVLERIILMYSSFDMIMKIEVDMSSSSLRTPLAWKNCIYDYIIMVDGVLKFQKIHFDFSSVCFYPSLWTICEKQHKIFDISSVSLKS